MAADNGSGGVGVAGLLGVAFVILKLTGVIGWSWWLVLLPFYFGFALAIVLLVFAMLCFGLAGLIDHFTK